MSRRGDCYDNAVIESFFATVKKEKADRFPSYSDAKMALFDYIEVFYNQRRRHSTIGYVSPAQFERHSPCGRSTQLEGALGGIHAPSGSSLAQATERLQGFLPPLTEQIQLMRNSTEVN
jgi:hypothetical protein